MSIQDENLGEIQQQVMTKSTKQCRPLIIIMSGIRYKVTQCTHTRLPSTCTVFVSFFSLWHPNSPGVYYLPVIAQGALEARNPFFKYCQQILYFNLCFTGRKEWPLFSRVLFNKLKLSPTWLRRTPTPLLSSFSLQHAYHNSQMLSIHQRNLLMLF